jgi:MerR family copper efflux transcriptional regulator
MSTMTIGRLAKAAGVNIDTIRYYERNGLIPEPSRRLSGYREYGATDIAKIKELQRVRRGLKTLIDACPGHGDLERCPIIAALSTDEPR